jgi:hypothetical protein
VSAQVHDQVSDQVRDQVHDQVGDQVRDQVRDQVSDQVSAQVLAQVSAQVLAQVLAQVSDQVLAQVSAQVRDQVNAQVLAQVRDQVSDQVRDQVRDQVSAQVSAQVRDQVSDQLHDHIEFSWPTIYGQHSAGWLSFYLFFRDCTNAPLKPFSGLEAGLSLGWCWLYKDVAIITERPSTLRRDERNRLHSADGMAISYPDGWGFWCWHGVRVPQQVIEAPETLTCEQIKAESNAEIRRVMVTRYGQDRYIRDAGAVVVAMDEVGVLYSLPQAGDEEIKMVRVLNSTIEPDGTQKEYMLRVPPTIKTPREAVAWTFDVTNNEYAPAVQT